jgi:hypothetical protein
MSQLNKRDDSHNLFSFSAPNYLSNYLLRSGYRTMNHSVYTSQISVHPSAHPTVSPKRRVKEKVVNIKNVPPGEPTLGKLLTRLLHAWV